MPQNEEEAEAVREVLEGSGGILEIPEEELRDEENAVLGTRDNPGEGAPRYSPTPTGRNQIVIRRPML